MSLKRRLFLGSSMLALAAGGSYERRNPSAVKIIYAKAPKPE